jgi:arsenate reductase
MAEGIANKYLKNHLIASAGTSPEPVNPNAIYSMKEIEIDISNNQSKKIDSNMLNNFDLVITLCDDARDKCPIIKTGEHIHWGISDPAKFQGSIEEVRLKYSKVRNIIYNNIKLLKDELNHNQRQ